MCILLQKNQPFFYITLTKRDAVKIVPCLISATRLQGGPPAVPCMNEEKLRHRARVMRPKLPSHSWRKWGLDPDTFGKAHRQLLCGGSVSFKAHSVSCVLIIKRKHEAISHRAARIFKWSLWRPSKAEAKC